MKWHERPVRMMRLDYIDQLGRMQDADLDELARSKAEDWHINCEWVIGTPGIAPGLGYLTTFNTDKFEKYADLGDWDLIREYLPYARKYGIKVLAYTNMHWFSYDFAAEHPDWEQLLADGTPYGRVSPLYGGGTTLCVNSGWRDWAQEMIKEIMKTGLDGVFLDGPVVFPGACYCAACREKFRKQYGANMPEIEDWSDENWKNFIEFREDSMAEFLRDCRVAMQSVDPNGVIFLNGGSWHAGAWRVARDIEKVGEYEDFNGAEAFFHAGQRDHVLHFWATAAKHLAGGGKPSVVFSHHALGSWHYIPLPPIECQLAIAQTAACGSNPWFAVFDYSLDHSRELALEGVRDIQGFLQKNEEYYTNAKSCADIALHYSRQTATYWMSEQDEMFGDRGSGQERDLIADMGTGKKIVDWKKRKQMTDQICGNSYLGWFTALTREHVSFDVILDKGLTAKGLAKYKTLIMPNSACLSDEQAQAVREFVKRGGGLVAEFETGEYDERGLKHKTNPLAEVLGVRSIEDAMPPAHGEEYIKVKVANPDSSAFTVGQLIARPPYSLKVRKAEFAQAPIVFMEQIGKVYSALKGETDLPALLANVQSGGRVVYISGLAGEFYGRYRMSEYQALLTDAVRWVHSDALTLYADCPSTVEIELWQQENPRRMMVHLVNNTGDMQRPISEIIPINEVKIRLRLGETPVSRVRELSAGRELEFTQCDDVVEFVVRDLSLYEVVVVE